MTLLGVTEIQLVASTRSWRLAASLKRTGQGSPSVCPGETGRHCPEGLQVGQGRTLHASESSTRQFKLRLLYLTNKTKLHIYELMM